MAHDLIAQLEHATAQLAAATSTADRTTWLRRIRDLSAAALTDEATLRLADDRMCLNGRSISLRRRHTGRRLLNALAHAGQRGLTKDALVRAGWPGERMHPDSARMRLHTAIRSLRKLGLGERLETTEHGYRLAPSLRVIRAA